MFRYAAIALMVTVGWAQEPAEKPPAGVDEALRARIEQFYHYFETQEFRKAEKFVAEDSQDFFYNHNKPHYLSTSIQSIKYFDHFTRATAIVLAEQFIMMPGFAGKPMKVPTTSTWKIVDGQWMWFVDPIESRRTPFGLIPEKPNAPSAGAASLPASIPTTPDFALNMVKPDQKSLEMKPGTSATVTFTNTARGVMMLSVREVADGIEATFDRTQLNADEKAVLTVKAEKGAHGGTVSIQVMPTAEMIAVPVTVK